MGRTKLLRSRRDFLKDLPMISSTLAAPTFLVRGIQGAQKFPGGPSRTGRILLVVELAGGCDGLNTIVPYANDFYYQ